MTLNAFVAQQRLAILEDLKAGRAPQAGRFDESVLKEAKAKGTPQAGATTYHPLEIVLEFIYPDPRSSSTVLPVTLTSPERIVFLPVPGWVVENIWQGEIAGAFHFESQAQTMVENFLSEITPENNERHFGPQAPKRRE